VAGGGCVLFEKCIVDASISSVMIDVPCEGLLVVVDGMNIAISFFEIVLFWRLHSCLCRQSSGCVVGVCL